MTETALVTGAASGIGRACAQTFLSAGWHVVGLDLHAGDLPEVSWTTGDVTDPTTLAYIAAESGPLRAVVNSAGIAARAPAAEMTADQWERVIATNLSGTFYVSQAFRPNLAAGGGTLVNIASIAGHRSFAGRANYCAAKAGVVALTEVLGLEWAPERIRVVAVSPGFVDGPMAQAGVQAGMLTREQVQRRTPQSRLAEPMEIARAIVALTSEAFSFMTGTTVIIDGGWCANGGLDSPQ